jgi:hypothetical protein
MNEIIKKLKVARVAHALSLEYNYCPSKGDKGYVEGLEESGYTGCRPDEIANSIMRLIDKLEA